MEDRNDNAADHALHDLGTQLEQTIVHMRAAGERIDQLTRLRAAGRPWFDIVSRERRPLLVEMITQALDDLGTIGGRFRREQARALQREQVSITRISQLYGVSRQRVSILVRDQPRRSGPGERPRENDQESVS